MSVEVIKYAGVAGEISGSFLGRSDLEKYDLGVAQAQNVVVDYRGGLSNRPGQEFVDLVQSDWKETKFVPFKFAPSVLTTYVVLFGYNYIRFIQDGAYVLETAKIITGITQANPGVVTSVGHGYTTGDLIKIFDVVGMTQLNAQTFVVTVLSADTFSLKKLDQAVSNFSTAALTAYVSGGNAYRVYTVVSPFADTDLKKLRAHQTRSIIRLTHPSYKTRTLTRISDTNWTIAALSSGATIGTPTGLTITPSAAGAAGMAFAVTAVDKDGQESLVSEYAFNSACVDYTTTAGAATLTWSPVASAKFYNVYRSQIIPNGGSVNRAMEVGFVGISFGPTFVDNNIIPDFTITPPTHLDPFADGAITQVDITAGGAGYTNASVVSASGGGTGFVAYAVVQAGVITGIVIINPGKNYVAPVISATVGAGATFTVTQSATSGNDPRVSTVFQQREVYAGSANKPLTINASRPGQLDVFDESAIVKDDDAYEHDLDSDEVAPIQDLVPTRSGLVLMSQAGVWHLSGDTQIEVTPTNAIATLQTTTGAADIPPLTIDTDLLYIENEGTTVRLLSYNDFTKVFAGQDMSILAGHLLKADNQVGFWTYASNPFKLVYGVRDDGVCLTLALVKEQNVYGWSRLMTQGRYKDVLTLQEDNVDSVYFMVQRYIDGRWGKTIERQKPRSFLGSEDAWFLDCALQLAMTKPAAALLIPDGVFGATVTITADAAVFGAGDVNKILRGAGGKFKVKVYNSTTSVDVQILREIPTAKLTPLLSEARVTSGNWTLDANVSSVFLGYPYEGYTVKVNADGNISSKVVTNGAITLDEPASFVIAGFGYRSIIQTLPPTLGSSVIEGTIKRPVAIKLRRQDSRGLQLGRDLDHLKPMKDRTDEPYGEPTDLKTDIKPYIIPGSGFDLNGQFFLVSDEPLPFTILGFTTKLDLADADS